MGESVDIVVSEAGSAAASDALAKVGVSANAAADAVDAANKNIDFLKGASAAAVSPLENLAAAATSAASASTNMSSAAAAQEGILRAQKSAADRLGESLEAYQARVAKAVADTGQSTTVLEANANATEKVHAAQEHASESGHALTETTSLLKEALSALGLIFTADKIIEITEVYQKVDLELKSVSRSTKELAENSKALYDISQLTGSSFGANANAFQKLTVETQALGIDQKDLLTTIKNVNAVIQESGGTSVQASQAVELFGRALATGEVSGRQFRTLLLDFPQLGQLVAQGLNTSVSSLVGTSQKAAVASKEFVDAFNKQALAANVAGKEIELTLGGAITTLGNSIILYVGRIESANGITSKLAGAVEFLAHNFSSIATAIAVATTVAASYYAVLVVIPGVLGLIGSAITALTVAVAANPLGFLVVALVSLIALVYEFGNSIKLTSDGSITVLGALIGIFNVLYNVVSRIAGFVSGPLSTAFNFLYEVIAAPFRLIGTLADGIINLLNRLGASIPGVTSAFTALLAPITQFKQIFSDAMVDATAKMNEAKPAAEGLGSLIDDQQTGGKSVGGAARSASAAVSKLGQDTTQMGRVVASVIPVFTNLYDAQRLVEQGTKRAADAMKAYSAEVDKNEAALRALDLVTRDAMGNMVKATDEWARRSGEDFNGVSSGAQKAADSAGAAMQSIVTAANAAAQAIQSVGGGETFVDSDQNIGAYFKSQGGTGGDKLIGLIEQLAHMIGTPQATPLLIQISDILSKEPPAAAHVITQNYPFLRNFLIGAGLPGYATGGSFDVGGSGGTDTQLVQFMASPGEKVTIETPEQAQRRSKMQDGARGTGMTVNMTVITPDANSFRRSQNQTLLSLKSRLNQVG